MGSKPANANNIGKDEKYKLSDDRLPEKATPTEKTFLEKQYVKTNKLIESLGLWLQENAKGIDFKGFDRYTDSIFNGNISVELGTKYLLEQYNDIQKDFKRDIDYLLRDIENDPQKTERANEIRKQSEIMIRTISGVAEEIKKEYLEMRQDEAKKIKKATEEFISALFP
jgi:hypothetical protein